MEENEEGKMDCSKYESGLEGCVSEELEEFHRQCSTAETGLRASF